MGGITCWTVESFMCNVPVIVLACILLGSYWDNSACYLMWDELEDCVLLCSCSLWIYHGIE